MFGDLQKNRNAVEAAIRSCTSKDGKVECLSGAFQELRGILRPNNNKWRDLPASMDKRTCGALLEPVESIHADLLNILKSCAWIDYIDRNKSSELDPGELVVFKSTLEVCVHALHVEFRSISDYIASLVFLIAGYEFDQDMVSFKQVSEWSTQPPKIPADLVELAQVVKMFAPFHQDIATIRNAIVHKGADAAVILNVEELGSRPGFAVLLRERNQMFVPDMLPQGLFEIGVIDLKIYFGLCIGFLIHFLNLLSESLFEILQSRKLLIWRETMHPYFPSTITKLVAFLGVRNAFQLMKKFDQPDSVPTMIAKGMEFNEIYAQIDSMEPITITTRKHVDCHATGSPAAIKFMSEALRFLDEEIIRVRP